MSEANNIIMLQQTVNAWKKRTAKEAAKEYSVNLEAIQIVPRNTKRKIYVTWKLLQPILCPINNKYYQIYWVRTAKEFERDAKNVIVSEANNVRS